MSEFERSFLEQALSCSVIGSPATVRQGLADFLERTGADELMMTSHIYEHAARLRSFELTAQVREAMAAEGALSQEAAR